MTKYIPKLGIKFTGLALGLDSFAPDALWVVLVDITADQFLRLRLTKPGRDSQEGRNEFVPATFEDPATREALAHPDWVSGGKASLIRAVEVIQSIKENEEKRLSRPLTLQETYRTLKEAR